MPTQSFFLQKGASFQCAQSTSRSWGCSGEQRKSDLCPPEVYSPMEWTHVYACVAMCLIISAVEAKSWEPMTGIYGQKFSLKIEGLRNGMRGEWGLIRGRAETERAAAPKSPFAQWEWWIWGNGWWSLWLECRQDCPDVGLERQTRTRSARACSLHRQIWILFQKS